MIQTRVPLIESRQPFIKMASVPPNGDNTKIPGFPRGLIVENSLFNLTGTLWIQYRERNLVVPLCTASPRQILPRPLVGFHDVTCMYPVFIGKRISIVCYYSCCTTYTTTGKQQARVSYAQSKVVYYSLFCIFLVHT